MIIELDKEKNSRLNISVSHDKGQYRLYVRQEFVEQRDGYQSIVSYPFADGNFWALVKEGRKSAKFLESMEQHLIKNAEKLKQLWLDNDYGYMVAVVGAGIK